MITAALGRFRFGINSANFNTMAETSNYPWVEQARLGRKPAMQIVAKAAREMTIDGVVYPHWRGGFSQIALMRREAERLEPLGLVTSQGDILGQFVIMSVSETRSIYGRDGTPQKQEFTLQLREYGEDEGGGSTWPSSM